MNISVNMYTAWAAIPGPRVPPDFKVEATSIFLSLIDLRLKSYYILNEKI